jgi:streptomycin 6-kinase
MEALSSDFTNRVVATFGLSGRRWLHQLPDLLARCEQRWSLRLEEPFCPLTYNYVAPGRGPDNTAIVLKAGVPNKELATEIAALNHFRGHGAVKLRDSDADQGVLLLDRVMPGNSLLSDWTSDKSTEIAAAVMRELHRPPPEGHTFPAVANWGEGFARLRSGFQGGTGPFPAELVERAERNFGDLAASMERVVVLHGDLHHWNIISDGEDDWLAIDPKGVLGEPAYEVGAWLRNPFPMVYEGPNVLQLIERRLDRFAEILSFDRSRMAGWAFSQGVLSAWWAYEDGEDTWPQWLEGAQILERLIR